jgi:hypothetical protein
MSLLTYVVRHHPGKTKFFLNLKKVTKNLLCLKTIFDPEPGFVL